MASQSAELDTETLWGGKESPFQTSYGKLMMWFFLVSDALTLVVFLLPMDLQDTILSKLGRLEKRLLIHYRFWVMVIL